MNAGRVVRCPTYEHACTSNLHPATSLDHLLNGSAYMLGYIKEMFLYDDWANHETLHSLEEMEHPPERARKVMSHIIAAELLWMSRLQQATQKTPVWPELGLVDCAQQLT